MKDSVRTKLENLQERYEEIGALLSEAEVISNQNKFRSLSQEYAEIEPVLKCFDKYKRSLHAIEDAKVMLEEDDAEIRDMAQEELKTNRAQLEQLETELNALMLPKDARDKCNVFLEIRAGTGGDEAAIFSGDLFKMYSRYADRKKWKVEILNESHGDHGGYKEIICRIEGNNVYSHLKFESGAHRVQRVPETESQGRVHTSACTVAIMAEPEGVEEVEINKNDLRIDTFRASGAGGQHVNKTDSAIRITYIPTGLVVECQEERSQHKNKAKAMSLLQAKLFDDAQTQAENEIAQERKSLVGSGDRSERIRTYNFPQGRLTDHRINLTLYKLQEIMEGDLDSVIQALSQEDQANKLAALGSE